MQLLIVTGKGGVGKSTVAAGLGWLYAERGREVLVLEVDPRETLHRLFETEPSGGAVVGVPVVEGIAGGLHHQNLRPRAAVDRFLQRHVPFPSLVKRMQGSVVYEQFVEGCPGLEEVAILGHALQVVEGSVPEAFGCDLVILDAPASGHSVSMLEAPRLLGETVESGPLGDLARQVSALIEDPARCSVVAVTLAEEMPVTETFELRERLRDQLGIEVDRLVINRLLPGAETSRRRARPAGGVEAAAASDPRVEAALELISARRSLQGDQIVRIGERWRGSRYQVPLFRLPAGRELGRRVAGQLDEEWS